MPSVLKNRRELAGGGAGISLKGSSKYPCMNPPVSGFPEGDDV
jgi:hypothetical protein